ncbi:hypothetical protein P4O66_002343 [Electrophorus voltai]|uniref:Uncharacterized protein n=1 Tax=Electrophorus voltai TaxID=2609070 RepID=A0AAD8YZV7_9TELE|nr:hypothetical protein P4O66_002343 [Electrophorus voltai]
MLGSCSNPQHNGPVFVVYFSYRYGESEGGREGGREEKTPNRSGDTCTARREVACREIFDLFCLATFLPPPPPPPPWPSPSISPISPMFPLVLFHIITWFGNCTAFDRKTLQRIVRTAEKIIEVSLPSITNIYITRCIRKATNIVKDPTNPSHELFTLLPSGRSLCTDCESAEKVALFRLEIKRLGALQYLQRLKDTLALRDTLAWSSCTAVADLAFSSCLLGMWWLTPCKLGYPALSRFQISKFSNTFKKPRDLFAHGPCDQSIVHLRTLPNISGISGMLRAPSPRSLSFPAALSRGANTLLRDGHTGTRRSDCESEQDVQDQFLIIIGCDISKVAERLVWRVKWRPPSASELLSWCPQPSPPHPYPTHNTPPTTHHPPPSRDQQQYCHHKLMLIGDGVKERRFPAACQMLLSVKPSVHWLRLMQPARLSVSMETEEYNPDVRVEGEAVRAEPASKFLVPASSFTPGCVSNASAQKAPDGALMRSYGFEDASPERWRHGMSLFSAR